MRRILYRFTWKYDLEASVIGERSACCENMQVGSASVSRVPGEGRGGLARPPLMLVVEVDVDGVVDEFGFARAVLTVALRDCGESVPPRSTLPPSPAE